MLKGSCLCGAIAYEITGELAEMGHCHCHMCQKAHGAAFGTYGMVQWHEFSLVKGEDQLGKYQSSDVITRSFCKQCGSTLQFIRANSPAFGLAVGTLDSAAGIMPSYQIWTDSKAPWCELEQGIKSYPNGG